MMTPMQKHDIFVWINEALKTLNSEHLFNDLEIDFNDRYTAKMGMARCSNEGELSVHFSTQLWQVANDTQRRQTVFHEICHIVNMSRGYFDAHGHSWQRLMSICGLPANRCTDVQRPPELRNESQRVIQAKCKCKTWTITKNRATRMQKGAAYRCLVCKTPLSLTY